MAVAVEEGDLAQLEIERARLDIMLDVSSAYYAVLAAQERLKVAAQLEQLAQQVRAVVALKVEAGKAARLELSRVDIDLASAGIAREQAQQELRRACAALSLLWAEPNPQFEAVDGELLLPATPPREDELRELLATSPDIVRWDQEASLRKAQRELAYADGIPDYTLSGGLERFEATDSFGFRIGISMPLPIRDRNQGSVVEAQRYLDQTADLKAVELRKAQRSLADVVAQMRIAYERAQALEEQVLPPAQETFDLTGYGYRHGKFGVLEVLDAERTLIEARSQYVEALAEYYLAGAQLERLIGQPLGLSEAESAPDSEPALPRTKETVCSPVMDAGQGDSDA
jgi:cobalt-zinc-cadmium efflux system outer membrane protein